MRFLASLTAVLAFGAALAPLPGLAQSWPNETGLGGDLLSASGRQFDRMRQTDPLLLEGGSTLPAAAGRPVIPLLDWAAPPAPLAVPQPVPRPAVRRVVRQAAPRPAATLPAEAARDEERSLSERERELDSLRRRLEEDRRRFEALRLAAAASRPAQPAPAPSTPVAATPRAD